MDEVFRKILSLHIKFLFHVNSLPTLLFVCILYIEAVGHKRLINIKSSY